MSHSYSDQKVINPATNPSFDEVLTARLSRRGLLKGAASLAMLGSLPSRPRRWIARNGSRCIRRRARCIAP